MSKRFPCISDAKRLALLYSLDGCIVFSVRGEQIQYASFGVDRRRCETTKALADKMFDAATGKDNL